MYRSGSWAIPELSIITCPWNRPGEGGPGDDGGGPDDGPPKCEEDSDCDAVCPDGLTCKCMAVGQDGSSVCVIPCEKDEDCPEIGGQKLTCNPGGFCSPGGPPPDGGGEGGDGDGGGGGSE